MCTANSDPQQTSQATSIECHTHNECNALVWWAALSSFIPSGDNGEERLYSEVPTIAEILKEIRPEADFTASQDFLGDGMLDSHDIVTLVSDLDKSYGISISGLDIIPENFQNAASIQKLVQKYRNP
jgi:acyl carrier protein